MSRRTRRILCGNCQSLIFTEHSRQAYCNETCRKAKANWPYRLNMKRKEA